MGGLDRWKILSYVHQAITIALMKAAPSLPHLGRALLVSRRVRWATGAVAAVLSVLLIGAIGEQWVAAGTIAAVILPTLVALPQWWDYISRPSPNCSVEGPSAVGLPMVEPKESTEPSPSAGIPFRDNVDIGDPVAWDTHLTRLVNALAGAISEPADIRRIKVQAGIAKIYVDPDGSPLNRWQVIVERAAEEGFERLDSLCELALAQSPKRELRDAVSAWRAAHGRGS
jgi:hypothetical protein